MIFTIPKNFPFLIVSQFLHLWKKIVKNVSGMGLSSHVATSYVGADTDAVYTTDPYNGFNLIRSIPLYFVRSGYVNDGSLYDSGAGGGGWSSTVGSGTYGYRLYFLSTTVYPARNFDRYVGFPVRCIAR